LTDEGTGNIGDKFKVGQTTDFEIVSLEPPEHRLGLRLFGVKGKANPKVTSSGKAEKAADSAETENDKKAEDGAAKKTKKKEKASK